MFVIKSAQTSNETTHGLTPLKTKNFLQLLLLLFVAELWVCIITLLQILQLLLLLSM